MIITYKIPSGIMCINADEFFQMARRSAIRRMFKQLRRDYAAAEEYTPQIREYLEEWEQKAHDEIARLYGKQVDAETLYHEVKTRYEEMQSPCYARFTRDEKVLAAARGIVRDAKSEVSYIKRGITEAQKMEKRYKEIQEDVVKILEGGRNGK